MGRQGIDLRNEELVPGRKYVIAIIVDGLECNFTDTFIEYSGPTEGDDRDLYTFENSFICPTGGPWRIFEVEPRHSRSVDDIAAHITALTSQLVLHAHTGRNG